MYWDKGENYLTPNTFNINGDTAFPLSLNYVDSFLYSWDARCGFGLGGSNHVPTVLPMYLSVSVWSKMHLPLWIANRLWHILPNILIGLGAYFLYRSLFNNRYSWICGTLASIFIITLPDRNIFPHGSMGFAGTLFMLGALIRGLYADRIGVSRRYAAAIYAIGAMMAIHYLRCLYITFLISGFVIIITLFYYAHNKYSIKQIVRFLILCIVLVLLFNSYWMINFIVQYFHEGEIFWPNSAIVEQRKMFQLAHQNMTNPVNILRATAGGAGSGVPSYYYYSHPLILPFTFLVPLFCFLPLITKKISKEIKILSLFSVFLSVYPISFHLLPSFNMFLRKNIPTFWIMNNPHYWNLYIGICYGLIIGSSTEYFLSIIKHRKNKIILFCCTSILIIIFGGASLFDRALISGFPLGYTLMGTKFPYVKIPEEYDEMEKYLIKNSKNTDRVWYIDRGGFKRYSWAYEGHMPEFMFFKSPITTIGRGMSFATPIIDLLSSSVSNNKHEINEILHDIIFLSRLMNIRYIFIHKDYFCGKDAQGNIVKDISYDQGDIDLNNFLNDKIMKNNCFRKVMDSNSFALYENMEFVPEIIYAAHNAIAVIGDIEMFPLIAQERAYSDKQVYLFKDYLENNDVDDQNIEAIVYGKKDENKTNLDPKEGLKIILKNESLQNREEEIVWCFIGQNVDSRLNIYDKNMVIDISRSGEFIFRAEIIPHVFGKYFVSGVFSEFKLSNEEELKKWIFDPRRVTYDYTISDNADMGESLIVTVLFDGDQYEDEFVNIKRKDFNVNLADYSFFAVEYKVEDPIVQTIEVVAGVDFNKDGLVDHYCRGMYPNPAAKEMSDFRVNLYNLVSSKFPNENYYDLVYLEIYPHKLWGMDCSSERKGKYKFWIKKIVFHDCIERKYYEDYEVYENAFKMELNSLNESENWKIDTKSDVKLSDNGKELNIIGGVPYLRLTRNMNEIDINRYPLIEFEYRSNELCLQGAEMFLGVDLDGDGLLDEDVSIGRVKSSEEYQDVKINAYSELKKKFARKEEFSLVNFGLKLDYPWPGADDVLNVRKLRVYKKDNVPAVGYCFDEPLFVLDGKEYNFKKKIQDKEDVENPVFKETISLEKGEHCLKKCDSYDFDIKYISIEPKIERKGQAELEIVYKKINPSRYEVQVKGAKDPFWLVLYESYHKKWKLFLDENYGDVMSKDKEQNANSIMFTPQDMKYFLKKPLDMPHEVVNGYANGWYIDPEKLGLGEEFSFTVYYENQSIFYLSLLISGLTIAVFLVVLGVSFIKLAFKRVSNYYDKKDR